MSDESGNQPKDQKPTNQSGGNGRFDGYRSGL